MTKKQLSAPKSSSILTQRSSGVLLHPTSLPGPYGIGDIGPSADTFLKFLAESKQRLWMMLPTSPTSVGEFHSPYSSYSAFAGNPLLISPDRLVESGACSALAAASFASRCRGKNPLRVDFRKVAPHKERFLREVFDQQKTKSSVKRGLDRFRSEQSWVEDFALFTSLRKSQGKPRSEWTRELRLKNQKNAAQLTKTLSDQIEFETYCQMIFFEQFTALKKKANQQGIAIFGDLPIYISDDSADVWASPQFFSLDKEKHPTLLSGCPPDAFATTWQLWGHPIYDWAALKRDNFSWWVDRMRTVMQLADVVRIDHFRGLAAYYAVPYGSKTAEHGKWYKCPGEGLLSAFQQAFGSVPVVAEDLGFITDDVHQLRDSFNLLGMRVLQFGFGADGYNTNIHAPFNVSPQSAIFTGTHDNDTAKGWLGSVSAEERKRMFTLMGKPPRSEFERAFVRLALSTPAKLAITPLQDILGLGSTGRMNRPGFARWDNWSWRFNDSLKSSVAWLGEISEATGRAG
jgi:4-alpha-glucanotransferase